MTRLKYLGILSSCFWKVKEESKDVSPLLLVHKVQHRFLGPSRFVLLPLSYFLSSPFHFQSQSAFHSTKVSYPTSSFFSFHPIQIFLKFPFACFFLNLPSSRMLFPDAVCLHLWKQEAGGVFALNVLLQQSTAAGRSSYTESFLHHPWGSDLE